MSIFCNIFFFLIFPQVTVIWDWRWKSLQQLMLATSSISTYSRWMGQTLSLNSGYIYVKDVRKTSLFLNFLFLCMHWLYMDIDMRTQYPFCSLFLFTEGIQNKGSVRSEIQKIKVYCMQHQKLCAVWKTTSPCNELHIQSKIFTYGCWKVSIQLPISVPLGKKKSNCW